MPPAPVVTFLDSLRDLALLTPAQHQELAHDLGQRFAEPRLLAKELLRRGWLTVYQVNQLLQGRGAELLMAGYILVERLGEGGTGQVFKARHQRMQRTVAIKLIRGALLADTEVVARFYREVQVLSQLSHPNIVHAYDAGPFGATHFLVMEYVEGTDLSVVVKRGGPLPVEQACDYIRQAAVGLQHAHEKGLVHRDIKPSNLLVTAAGDRPSALGPNHPVTTAVWPVVESPFPPAVVKILDLGLARLHRAADGEITSTLTPVGSTAVTMGTPDYLAPEQALDFHQVDVRADIYSLGCTFFFLLTGQPPFPGGSMAQKLMKHQQAEPPPLARFRKDVPPGVELILRRMLAKNPAERYPSPEEVAVALANLGSGPGIPSTQPLWRKLRLAVAAAMLVGLLLSSWAIRAAFRGQSSAADSAGPVATSRPATAPPTPGADDLPVEELARLIRPSPEEDKWLDVPWLISLWEARQVAARAGKPIFLWNPDGHALGCTSNTGIEARAGCFAAEDIRRRICNDFIAVATDDWYLRRRQDAEGQFFIKVSNQSPRKGTGEIPRAGMYCLTADGQFLAWGNAPQNIDSTRRLIEQALAQWAKLPEAQRKPGAVTIPDHGPPEPRYNRQLSLGTRIVTVHSRILVRGQRGNWARATSSEPVTSLPGRDHLWVTAEEQKALTARSRVGERIQMPPRLADRLVRFHLTDTTRGHPYFWAPESVRGSTLTLTVASATPQMVVLRLDGSVRLATDADPGRAERGYEPRLHGSITFDPRTKLLTGVEVIAMGDSWGPGLYNAGNRPRRTTLGVAFSLAAGTTPADQAPPGAARDLGGYLEPWVR